MLFICYYTCCLDLFLSHISFFCELNNDTLHQSIKVAALSHDMPGAAAICVGGLPATAARSTFCARETRAIPQQALEAEAPLVTSEATL